MTQVILQLSDEMLQRLRDEAQRLNMPLEAVINTAITHYFEEDEPDEAEILAGLRQAMIDALAGNVRPADEVLAELIEEFDPDADKS